MPSETLVEALERAKLPWCPMGECAGCSDFRHTVAKQAPTLLPLLVAHATEAERAALLRTLLGERCGDCEGEGFTVDTFLDCCGHPDREGLCCGDAVPRQHQIGCERCQTTGFLAPSEAR